jgi:anti-sigma regulatory factor (Ser/Thr protein kinase)
LRSAQSSPDGLRLVLNNTLAAVEDGRQEILRYLGPLDPRLQNRLEVLFEELVVNVIRHGFVRGSDQSIHVLIEKSAGDIQLTFEDDGVPFNPLEAEAPEPFRDIETARIGGLGIPLALKMASTIRYERPKEAGGAFRIRNRVIVSVASRT